MVMPRAFSSFRRSASMPVSAFTSEVLPWSMWPAVPMIMFWPSNLELQLPELADQFAHVVVFQAAQIQAERALCNPADDGHWKSAERLLDLFQRGAFTFALYQRSDGDAYAGQHVDGQRAAADLGVAGFDRRIGLAGQRAFHRRQQLFGDALDL